MFKLLAISAIIGINTYILYIQYTRLGIPAMFYAPITLASLASIAITTAVAIIAGLIQDKDKSDEESSDTEIDYEETAQAEKIWREITSAQYNPPPAQSQPKQFTQQDNGADVSPLVAALAKAIESAHMKTEMGLHMDIDPVKVSLGGGVKGTLHGSLHFISTYNDVEDIVETRERELSEDRSNGSEERGKEQTISLQLEKPPLPIDQLLRNKIMELRGEV